LSYVAADGLTMVDLVALWNRVYEAYLVPFVVDEAGLATHVRRAGIVLSRSVVAVAGGAPVALSVAAIRGRRAWIGGFGVARAWRRRGVARELLEHHVGALSADVDEVTLEVLEENPARALYTSVGFTDTGELVSLVGVPSVPALAASTPTLARLAEAHARLNRDTPTWRREWPSVEDAMRAGASAILVGEAEGSGYAVARRVGEAVVVGDAQAHDATSAERLYAALAYGFPGATLRVVDDRSGSCFSAVGQALGLTVVHRQRAMALRLR